MRYQASITPSNFSVKNALAANVVGAPFTVDPLPSTVNAVTIWVQVTVTVWPSTHDAKAGSRIVPAAKVPVGVKIKYALASEFVMVAVNPVVVGAEYWVTWPPEALPRVVRKAARAVKDDFLVSPLAEDQSATRSPAARAEDVES